MGNSRRLTIRPIREVAMTVTRASIAKDRVCYMIVADKKQKYKMGRSRVVYIGTTRAGVRRLASSAARRAPKILGLRGVRSFAVHVVSCRRRPGIKTWLMLERALLLVFREIHGTVPSVNRQGNGIKPHNEFRCFRKSRLKRILEDVS